MIDKVHITGDSILLGHYTVFSGKQLLKYHVQGKAVQEETKVPHTDTAAISNVSKYLPVIMAQHPR